MGELKLHIRMRNKAIKSLQRKVVEQSRAGVVSIRLSFVSLLKAAAAVTCIGDSGLGTYCNEKP